MKLVAACFPHSESAGYASLSLATAVAAGVAAAVAVIATAAERAVFVEPIGETAAVVAAIERIFVSAASRAKADEKCQ